jgi:hypothetical protein
MGGVALSRRRGAARAQGEKDFSGNAWSVFAGVDHRLVARSASIR